MAAKISLVSCSVGHNSSFLNASDKTKKGTEQEDPRSKQGNGVGFFVCFVSTNLHVLRQFLSNGNNINFSSYQMFSLIFIDDAAAAAASSSLHSLSHPFFLSFFLFCFVVFMKNKNDPYHF